MVAVVEAPTRTNAEPSSRSEILRAASEEFALKGYAGARTEGIARAAGVKHTLVFYHFKTKDLLYSAVLGIVFSEWAESVSRALDGTVSPKRRLFAYINAYFDCFVKFPFAPRLVQQEQLRQSGVGPEHLQQLVKRYVHPVHRKLAALLRDGISSGEFRDLDIEQCIYSLSALINFYFTDNLSLELRSGTASCSPERLAARRAAVLDFVSTALFTSRKHQEIT